MTTSLNVSLDSKTIEQAQWLFEQLGLDIATAMNIFLRDCIRRRGIALDLFLDSEPDSELLEAIADVEAGRNLYGPYETVDEAMKAMLEDD